METIKLNNGIDIPLVGLGTYSLKGDICIKAIMDASDVGYRLFDTASLYDNEGAVGEGLRKSGLKREDYILITKLYPSEYDRAKAAIDQALARLKLDYIDIMMLHHPSYNDLEAYLAIEEAITSGKVKMAGLSCYYRKEIDYFLPHCQIKPVLVQNELHPYYQDSDNVSYLQNLDLVVQSWYPLGGRGYNLEMMNDPLIKALATKYQKSPAQIILRFNIERKVIVIPGSKNRDHLRANLDIFDFGFNAEELKLLAGLDRHEKHDWY